MNISPAADFWDIFIFEYESIETIIDLCSIYSERRNGKHLDSLLIKNNFRINLKSLINRCRETFSRLASLSVTFCSIKNLDPLGCLRNIEFLNCSYNEITCLKPLKGLVSLQTLIFEGNRVTSLVFLKDLKNLKILSFFFTEVSSLLPISRLENLRRINMETRFLKESYKGFPESVEILMSIEHTTMCIGFGFGMPRTQEELQEVKEKSGTPKFRIIKETKKRKDIYFHWVDVNCIIKLYEFF